MSTKAGEVREMERMTGVGEEPAGRGGSFRERLESAGGGRQRDRRETPPRTAIDPPPPPLGVMTEREILQELSDMARGIKDPDRYRIIALKTLLSTYRGPQAITYPTANRGEQSDNRNNPTSIDQMLPEDK